MADRIRIEVAYARPDAAFCIPVELPAGISAAEAIRESGLLEQCPEIDLDVNRIGIFARPCDPGDRISDGDRIEVYRPLQLDPKEARRRRAAKRTGQ